MQAFLPIHLHHWTGRSVSLGFVTELCDVLDFLTDCVSSCYHDDAHGPHHPKHFVNVDVAAFACPFPSARACVLFFHDASVHLRYPSVKMKQKWNDHVYAFYVLLGLGLAPVTYREQIEYNALEENREYVQFPCRSTRGRRPDTEGIIDTLLSAAERKNDEGF